MKYFTGNWDEVWIIGNGPSGKDFDPTLWRPGRVLALNEVAFRFHEAGIFGFSLFSLDGNWVRRRREFLDKFSGEKYLCLPLDTFSDCADITGVEYLNRSSADGLSDDPETLNTGCNSGYAAINLAYLRGATKIHLIGYDMDPSDPHSDQYKFWAPMFQTMVPQLTTRNITVLNHNPKSFINAFCKVKTAA